jgi:hypothetical protein
MPVHSSKKQNHISHTFFIPRDPITLTFRLLGRLLVGPADLGRLEAPFAGLPVQLFPLRRQRRDAFAHFRRRRFPHDRSDSRPEPVWRRSHRQLLICRPGQRERDDGALPLYSGRRTSGSSPSISFRPGRLPSLACAPSSRTASLARGYNNTWYLASNPLAWQDLLDSWHTILIQNRSMPRSARSASETGVAALPSSCS